MNCLPRILTFLAILSTTACVGPLVLHESARTVGDGNHELGGGYGNSGHVMKYTYGITQDLDFGVHWETLSIGLRMKYAFINAQKGFSLAGAGGIGESLGGYHYYVDLIASYATKRWEPYSLLRVVRVQLDSIDFKNEDTGSVTFTIPGSDFTYGQFGLGTRFWITPGWFLSAEASSIFGFTRGFESNEAIFVSAAFGYRWL